MSKIISQQGAPRRVQQGSGIHPALIIAFTVKTFFFFFFFFTLRFFTCCLQAQTVLAEFGGDKNVLGQVSTASAYHAGRGVADVTINDALKNLPRWTVMLERDLQRTPL